MIHLYVHVSCQRKLVKIYLFYHKIVSSKTTNLVFRSVELVKHDFYEQSTSRSYRILTPNYNHISVKKENI